MKNINLADDVLIVITEINAGKTQNSTKKLCLKAHLNLISKYSIKNDLNILFYIITQFFQINNKKN